MEGAIKLKLAPFTVVVLVDHLRVDREVESDVSSTATEPCARSQYNRDVQLQVNKIK